MKHDPELIKMLDVGAKELGLTLSDQQKTTLLNYVSLLHKWNQVYNLTAVRDPQNMLIRHVLDSLSVHTFIKGPRALDVGSGAGLPGIPLAICDPSTQWVLLDSNGKKTRFMSQAKAELDLANVEVEQARIESYNPPDKFNTIISRAFSNLPEYFDKSNRLIADNGSILAMKGTFPKEDLTNFSAHATVHPLKVPYLNEQRHIVTIQG